MKIKEIPNIYFLNTGSPDETLYHIVSMNNVFNNYILFDFDQIFYSNDIKSGKISELQNVLLEPNIKYKEKPVSKVGTLLVEVLKKENDTFCNMEVFKIDPIVIDYYQNKVIIYNNRFSINKIQCPLLDDLTPTQIKRIIQQT